MLCVENNGAPYMYVEATKTIRSAWWLHVRSSLIDTCNRIGHMKIYLITVIWSNPFTETEGIKLELIKIQ